MAKNFTELAFTDSVRKMQEDYDTRSLYERFEAKAPTRNVLTEKEKEFVARRDGFYLGSVGENGWPYLQFRGGPPGFLKVLEENVLAFADFRGNGQFISAGNFDATGKTVLFLMDYANRQRLKIWAQAVVLRASDHLDLLSVVAPHDYDATVERIFKFTVEAVARQGRTVLGHERQAITAVFFPPQGRNSRLLRRTGDAHPIQ